MLRDIDNWYLQQPEPAGSCLQALRKYLQQTYPDLQEDWKYRMPGFLLNGKMFIYLWKDKKTGHPYILIVNGNLIDHPALEAGDRKRMKTLPINPNCDLPLALIDEVLQLAIAVN